MHDFETTIIGAGIVGLSVGRRLALAGRDVLILEQHGQFGHETSSRNSEVIHAGIYYEAGSLKARLCVEGRRELYAYCERRGIPFRRTGKLIVAVDRSQVAELELIDAKARANGVTDLQFLDKSELARMEPALAAEAALLSPSTGIIDSHAFMAALLADATDHGATIVFRTPVTMVEAIAGGYRLHVAGAEPTTFTTRDLVIAAGLRSGPLVAESATPLAASAPTTAFAKGNYFALTGKSPFSRLVYPVPEPGGLGVHLTLDLAGRARFGPDVEWIDAIDYAVDPARGVRFVDTIRRFWPGLPDNALRPDYAGIRPKIGGRAAPNADFSIVGGSEHGARGMVALYGIESPGLTASLAIATHVEVLLSR